MDTLKDLFPANRIAAVAAFLTGLAALIAPLAGVFEGTPTGEALLSVGGALGAIGTAIVFMRGSQGYDVLIDQGIEMQRIREEKQKDRDHVPPDTVMKVAKIAQEDTARGRALRQAVGSGFTHRQVAEVATQAAGAATMPFLKGSGQVMPSEEVMHGVRNVLKSFAIEEPEITGVIPQMIEEDAHIVEGRVGTFELGGEMPVPEPVEAEEDEAMGADDEPGEVEPSEEEPVEPGLEGEPPLSTRITPDDPDRP